MDSRPTIDLPDYIFAAEEGFRLAGPLSFTTKLITPDEITIFAERCLNHIDVTVSGYGWGENGLMLDFDNRDDLAFFSLAYKGERVVT